MALTDLAIRNLKPGEKRREVPVDNTGLYLILQPSGARSYAQRYRFRGVPKKLTFDGGITLKAARKLAADALLAVEQGIDPAEVKQAAKAKTKAAKADTVEAICREWVARKGDGLRTIKTVMRAFEGLIFPAIGHVPVNDLRRSQIIRLIEKIQDEHGERRGALAFSYLRAVLNWHAPRSDDFKSPIVAGMVKYDTAAHARSRTLTDDELRAVWRATETEAPFHALVRFLVLSGARYGEAAGLTRAEIDDGTWHLPAARNKTKQPLARPLSKAALTIVEAQPRIGDGPLVFSNDGHRRLNPSKPKRALVTSSGISGCRLHDLRRTSRSLMSRAGVSSDIAERCLGHVIGGVRGVYDRHAYQREMAEAFGAVAALVERVIAPPKGGNVRQLRRRG
jgi:integrase